MIWRAKGRAALATFVFACACAMTPGGGIRAAEEGSDDRAGPTIRYGGALRFNAFYKTWDETNKEKSGDILLDTFRIEADGSYKDLFLSTEYRIYSGYHMLHHGYAGWHATGNTDILFGVHQVPFGIQPYSSHNWFFDVGYYVGLEDDYDLGLQSITHWRHGSLKIAFYKNDEGNYTGDSLDSARYSYDLVHADIDIDADGTPEAFRNEEINQFNVRYVRSFGNNEFGVSGQYGQVFNGITEDTGDHTAFGIHWIGSYGPWSLHAAAQTYEYDLPDGSVDPDIVAYGAYDFPYTIAAEGNIALFNVAYTTEVHLGPIETATFYNNFSMLDKDASGFETTYQDVLGVALAAGPLYVYCDIASGKNHPWLGGDWVTGLAQGDPDADWETRYNINFGWYF